MLDHSNTVEGGFAQPVLEAQVCFRALMDALSRPGEIQSLIGTIVPPRPLPIGVALAALTLADHDSPVWLDAELAERGAVISWLRFHTGAPLTGNLGAAQFALVSAASRLPLLEQFAQGSDEYPDRSTTIILAVESLTGGTALALKGPGIKDETHIAPIGLPENFIAQWTANRERFPRGIDLLLVAGTELIGLPRTARISLRSA